MEKFIKKVSEKQVPPVIQKVIALWCSKSSVNWTVKSVARFTEIAKIAYYLGVRSGVKKARSKCK